MYEETGGVACNEKEKRAEYSGCTLQHCGAAGTLLWYPAWPGSLKEGFNPYGQATLEFQQGGMSQLRFALSGGWNPPGLRTARRGNAMGLVVGIFPKPSFRLRPGTVSLMEYLQDRPVTPAHMSEDSPGSPGSRAAGQRNMVLGGESCERNLTVPPPPHRISLMRCETRFALQHWAGCGFLPNANQLPNIKTRNVLGFRENLAPVCYGTLQECSQICA